MFRKIVFWGHLAAGLAAGVFVLLMAVTGVVLTYETQITDFAVAQAVTVPAGGEPLGPDMLVSAVLEGGAEPGQTLILPREAGTPASLRSGRSGVAVDPYTGATLPDAGAAIAAFFASVTALHRWLSLSGPTDVGGAMIGASNLVFLLLVISGLYLWLPPAFRWGLIRMRLVFRRGLPSAQARHYNWHHAFGFWALVPLFVIVLSGVVMSYPWANSLLYAAVGEEAPQGRGGPGGNAALPTGLRGAVLAADPQSYDALIASAAEKVPEWKRASITLPAPEAAYLQVTMDAGNGVQSAAQTQIVLDRATTEIVSEGSGQPGQLGSRLRRWLRFAHTGQIYGVIGQTVAGLASLAAVMLVYTGISLGLRRLARMRRQRRAVA